MSEAEEFDVNVVKEMLEKQFKDGWQKGYDQGRQDERKKMEGEIAQVKQIAYEVAERLDFLEKGK